MRLKLFILLQLFFNVIHAQQADHLKTKNQQAYLAELKALGKQFTADFYPHYDTWHSLPERIFIEKIDSVRKNFVTLLSKYRRKLDSRYLQEQQLEIKYYFDKLLIEYPQNHDTYTGRKSNIPSSIPKRLKSNLADFNKPELLINTDFTSYVEAFLSYRVQFVLNTGKYRGSDNRQLNAVWNLIPTFFTNPACKTFWQSHFLYNHIENNGIKNTELIYANFRSSCKDTARLNKVAALYSANARGRQGHLVKSYKSVGGLNLDLHLFLPDSLISVPKRPVKIYFHGGSWSEGKPDWFFDACRDEAKKGWIACAVEYRTYSRHGTLPFAAVMDAKSAIRWLRQHAVAYLIDTAKIVASGNSAGGHLVLCAALADKWNEKTDDLKFSPVPNVLLVNAGVYDLTDRNTAWIRKNLQNKHLVKEISPVYLTNKHLPPTLLIHGTEDGNVPYSSAKKFADEMTNRGNIELQTLKDAGHFIWFDPKFAPEVSRLRSEFLNRWGY